MTRNKNKQRLEGLMFVAINILAVIVAVTVIGG